jgi:DNA-binding MarR family transcriptional regulator
MSQERQSKKRQFAEDFALLLERMGLPPMAGRIWGWLLVCDPPHHTAAELADAVGASLGSVSSMTRLLEQFGVIERFSLPGHRRKRYRLKAGGFTELLKAKMAFTVELRQMADRGLDLLRGESPEVHRRLKECRDFYAFFEQRMPALVEEWEQEAKGGRR